MKHRIDYFDNIKGLLIVLVVFGHMLEAFLFSPILHSGYLMIYCFHMPFFVMISGYFASLDKKKIVTNLIMPYLIFQSLYFLFFTKVMKETRTFDLMTPHWILWYLFSLILWRIFLVLVKEIKPYMIVLSIILALVVGFYPTIGYYASLSRTFVFFPFFLIGRYLKQIQFDFDQLKKPSIKILTGLATLGIFLFIAINSKEMNQFWFYGSLGYKAVWTPYNVWIRFLLLISGFIISLAIGSFMTKKKIPFLSSLGKMTLSIYLLHGFMVKYLFKAFPLHILTRTAHYLPFAIIATIVILLVGSLPLFTSGMNYLTGNKKLLKKTLS